MDTFTIKHLARWCRDQFPRRSEEVFEQMLERLQAMDEADLAYALEQGWWKVFDRLPREEHE